MLLKRKTLIFLICISCLLIFSGCSGAGISENTEDAGVTEDFQPVAKPITQPEPVTVTISFVGDIMVHADQLESAYNPALKTYCFDSFFNEVKPYLSKADLAVGNSETTISGVEKRYTGYPQFNSPRELLTAIKGAGFDVLTTANNHSLDRREYGVHKTIDNLEREGLKHTGTFKSEAEREIPLVINVKGVKAGILAYTYGTNGIPIPEGKDYLVNLINVDKIKDDINKTREAGADIVIVCPHFGVEYRRVPGEQEKKLVEEIFRAGADIVVGSHPHVLQQMMRRDLDENLPGLFAAYSLGNFISGQRGKYKDSGIILNVVLEKDLVSGKVSLADVSYIPTWVHKYRENGKLKFRVLAVEKAIRDYEQGVDKLLTPKDFARLKQVLEETTSLFTGPESPRLMDVSSY